MGIILLVLLLAIILGGLGFAIHVLWWIALAILVIWLLGFALRVGEGSDPEAAGTGGSWARVHSPRLIAGPASAPGALSCAHPGRPLYKARAGVVQDPVDGLLG